MSLNGRAQTANGGSSTVDFYASLVQVRVGTFDRATVELRIYDSQRDDYVRLDSTDAVFTAEGSANLEIPSPSKLPATLASAGGRRRPH